jgi:hypothetical protein
MSLLDANRAAAALVSLAVALWSLEFLSLSRQFEPRGVFSSSVFDSTRARGSGVREFVLRGIGSPKGLRLTLLLRLAAAVVIAFATAWPGILSLALACAITTGVLLSYRCGGGGEGADQMTTVVLAGLLACSLAALGRWSYGSAGLWFIAAQCCLAYCAAGIAKLGSPLWRSGDAVVKVMKTASFGSTRMWKLTSSHPLLGRVTCWSVIVFECLFPAAMILPKPFMYAILLAGAAFHLALAFVMGLNNFVWAFLAAYPAVVYCNERVGAMLGR